MNDPRQSLALAVSTALSDMAFLDTTEVADEAIRTPTSSIVVTGFTRPFRGHIALYLSLDCKRAVAENVFGGEWDTLSAAQIDDCLLELGNVIAGNFLTACAGPESAHDVSLPEIRFDDVGLECGGERLLVTYDAEGRALSVLLCLER